LSLLPALPLPPLSSPASSPPPLVLSLPALLEAPMSPAPVVAVPTALPLAEHAVASKMPIIENARAD
jgi:hypothetical protein